MSSVDLLVIASNLIVAFGLAAYCYRRDHGIVDTIVEDIVESVSKAGVWRQPLNSYPVQHPAQN